LSDMFPISNGLKQGEALKPLLCNVASEYAIRRAQVNQDGLKLNGTHPVLVYVVDANTRIKIKQSRYRPGVAQRVPGS